MEKAIFGAGCFWGIEETFKGIKGVQSTSVGYSGGATKDPTYQDVCSGTTGHAEVVEVDYDPSVVTYESLLKVFWECHNPTTLNRQGPDVGTQYRSAIYYLSPEQKSLAEASKEEVQKSGNYDKELVTEITEASEYYKAEEYHQQYFEKLGHVRQ